MNRLVAQFVNRRLSVVVATVGIFFLNSFAVLAQPDDPFAGLEPHSDTAKVPQTEPVDSSHGFFEDNFTFKKELYFQLSFGPEANPTARMTVGTVVNPAGSKFSKNSREVGTWYPSDYPGDSELYKSDFKS